MTNSEFKQLLKEGSDSIANRQNKTVRAVEQEILSFANAWRMRIARISGNRYTGV